MNRKGAKPGFKGGDLRGLKVQHAEQIDECDHQGHGKPTGASAPAGWFVFVQFKRGNSRVWEAVTQLRFARERDAKRAVAALAAAGIDSAKRMKLNPELTVRTAFEALEW